MKIAAATSIPDFDSVSLLSLWLILTLKCILENIRSLMV